MAAASSRVKLFDKVLSDVDIQGGLALELDSLAHIPTFCSENGYFDFNVVDEEGKSWLFRCFTGGGFGSLATKPVIFGGWCEFVRHHNLKAKDKVNFYGIQGESNYVSFEIHIRRTIKLFGVDITQGMFTLASVIVYCVSLNKWIRS
ncbi:hypothetical protein V2J09_001992 [Rumex salicifolius]